MTEQLTNLIKQFNHISIRDLEEILEYLQDTGGLSKDGISLRKEVYDEFIKSPQYDPYHIGAYVAQQCPACGICFAKPDSSNELYCGNCMGQRS